MNLTPFYRHHSPSKDIQNHFKESGGIQAYTTWKNRRMNLGERTAELMAVLLERNNRVSNTIADAIAKLPADNRNTLLEAFKLAFGYLAPLWSDLSDGRNEASYAFFRKVSAEDFAPELSSTDAKSDAERLATAGLAEEHVATVKTVFDAYTGYTSQEIAESFVGEFTTQHRSHQQSIICALHGAFVQLHLHVDGDSDNALGWALKAGRTNCYFPYI